MSSKDIVVEAVGELFADRDPGAVDRWVAEDYRTATASSDPFGRRRADRRGPVVRSP